MPPETRGPAEPDACRPDGGVILIVEDNDTNALILRAMLRKNGYAAVVARDGAEGVEMAERLRPPLVLLDLHMPRLDGVSALARMRQDHPRLCLIAITADTAPELHQAAEEAGADAVLMKDELSDELSDRIVATRAAAS